MFAHTNIITNIFHPLSVNWLRKICTCFLLIECFMCVLFCETCGTTQIFKLFFMTNNWSRCENFFGAWIIKQTEFLSLRWHRKQFTLLFAGLCFVLCAQYTVAIKLLFTKSCHVLFWWIWWKVSEQNT